MQTPAPSPKLFSHQHLWQSPTVRGGVGGRKECSKLGYQENWQKFESTYLARRQACKLENRHSTSPRRASAAEPTLSTKSKSFAGSPWWLVCLWNKPNEKACRRIQKGCWRCPLSEHLLLEDCLTLQVRCCCEEVEDHLRSA